MMIDHPFINRAPNVLELFRDTKSLNDFIIAVQKNCEYNEKRMPRYKYNNGAIGLLSELFFKYVGPEFGFNDYQILYDNVLVEATLNNNFNEKSLVKCVYSSNKEKELTANKYQLSYLFTESGKNNINLSESSTGFRHLVFTTAKGLDQYTKESFFKNKVGCIGYDIIDKYTDEEFWNYWFKKLEDKDGRSKAIVSDIEG